MIHFFLSLYGAKYLPFLRVCLESISRHHPEARITVWWEDIPKLEIKLLRLLHPGINLEPIGIAATQENNHQRLVSIKLRHQAAFLEGCREGELIAFLDVDTLVMEPLHEHLSNDFDVLFTWKPEQFPLNAGIFFARKNLVTVQFFQTWLLRTEARLKDSEALRRAMTTFGSADQFELAQLISTYYSTHDFVNEYSFGSVKIALRPCSVLNETNSLPLDSGAKIFHLKGGWHPILLEGAPYTKWRTKQDCEDLANYWKSLDAQETIQSWRSFVLSAARLHQDRFSETTENENDGQGLLDSEMLAMIAVMRAFEIEVVIEAGLYWRQQTNVLAEVLQGTSCMIYCIEWIEEEIAEDTEQRLAPHKNLQLHYGDVAEIIPRTLEQEKGKQIAILLDAPLGPEALQLFSDSIANHPNVMLGFIGDLRGSHLDLLNPNDVFVQDYFERVFFTDDEAYGAQYGPLDPHRLQLDFGSDHTKRHHNGSYLSRLGIVFPTERDRFRARKRLADRQASEALEAILLADSDSVEKQKSILKKLHRIPGFVALKHFGKWLLGRASLRETTNTSSKEELATGSSEQDESPEVFRVQLAKQIDVGSDDIIIDCGANVGEVVAKFVDSGAIIFAFEPNPHAFEVLAKRFHDHVNVVCFPMAILDREATIKLHLHEWSEQDPVKWSVDSSLLEYKGNVLADQFVEVEAIDLSEFIFRVAKRIKLLKMDIEGAEYETLTRLIERGLTDQIDHILVETHEKKIPELREKHAALLHLIEERNIQNIDLSWV